MFLSSFLWMFFYSGAGFCHEAFSAKPTWLWAKSTRPWWLQRAMLSPFGAQSSFGKASSQWHRCFLRFDPTTSSLTWQHGGSLHVSSSAAGPCASVAREDQNCTMWSWFIIFYHPPWLASRFQNSSNLSVSSCHGQLSSSSFHHHHQGKVGTAEFPL